VNRLEGNPFHVDANSWNFQRDIMQNDTKISEH
jgi:hypothetical protein